MSKGEDYTNIDDLTKFKPNLFQKGYWPVRRLFKDIPYNIRKIKWFWQRGIRGYCDCDVWNMDYYLVSIILPMLKQLKETLHGYPGNLTEEKWNKLLDEMIIGFEAAKRVIEGEYNIDTFLKDYKIDEKLFQQKMKIFTKYFFHLWD